MQNTVIGCIFMCLAEKEKEKKQKLKPKKQKNNTRLLSFINYVSL